MEGRKLPKLKRKAGASWDKLMPLTPEPDITDLQVSKCCGTLHMEGVLVTDLKHCATLVRLGSYGKGIFSRSVPTHKTLPKLSEFYKSTKRKAIDGGELMSSDAATLEWVDKLRQFEESQHMRMQLHSEWSKEQEEKTIKDEQSKELMEGEIASSSRHVEETVTNDPGQTENSSKDISSTGATGSHSLSSETLLINVKEHYDGFVERMESLAKNDPYKMTEHLQLSSEEALYLVGELGVLQVSSSAGKQLNSTELWNEYISTNPSFVERYTAYRYYRKKDWVPKSGLKFGVDFLLYKEGPAFYHSSYAVVVRLIDKVEPTFEGIGTPRNTGLTWKEVIALNRVNESAGKELVICYVVKPPSLKKEELTLNYICLEQLEVKEIIVKRWVPDKERNTKS